MLCLLELGCSIAVFKPYSLKPYALSFIYEVLSFLVQY